MTPTLLNKSVVGVALAVASLGALDASVGRNWDLAVVFALLGCLNSVLLLRLQSRRPSIPIRADLVGWLRARSAATGEPLELIADRCIARTRADLSRK